MIVKRLFICLTHLFVVFMVFDSLCWAAGAPAGTGPLGVGLELGSPTGATIRYWMDSRNTIQGGLGWESGDDLTVTADYLRSDFSAFTPRNSQVNGKLAFNYGVGARIRSNGDDTFGIRGIAGISYFFPRNPFELFAELVPVLVFEDHPEGELDGDIGFRYYFR